jgi:hypothetical protein
VVTGTSCAGPDHTYAVPGVYSVTVSVTDNDGGTGGATSANHVVVYDAAGGFVTGGGWIDSPAGAYVPNPSLDGKATFAFVAKYTKGNSTPTGNTQFRFNTASFFFQSDSYDWLVVTQGGTTAQFKGAGTANGEVAPDGSPYRFILWARNGKPDTFRIKVWWEDSGGTETVVYDNGFDQAIGGGAIAVQSGK